MLWQVIKAHRLGAAAVAATLSVGLLTPARALAHGPVDPAATSYLATVRHVPPGVQAQVVDGDQRMWLQARSHQTVVVIDYRGAPYLRFTAAGVQVNHNSSMYYLNQVPVQAVPAGLTPSTRPLWRLVSSGRAYSWHDGRLHALATTALAPGATYVGAWSVPVILDGRRTAITGGLRYAPDPSLVWFWPIVVAIVCVLAGLRLDRAALDERLARGLTLTAALALALAGAGAQLHGRPTISVGQYILLAMIAALVAWALVALVLRRGGWFGYFLLALATIWEGATLVGVLTHGFVLVALPGFVARVAVTGCLAAGGALLPVIFRLAERPERPGRVPAAGGAEPAYEDEDAWELEA